MSFTLPSGTTASPRAKIRSAAWNAAFNAVAAALNLRRESTEVVPAQYGGTGKDTSTSTGQLELDGGTYAVVRYGRHVGSFGAVGDGVTDDSAALQAAVNSNFPYIHGEPGAIYRIGTKVTIPAMASMDLERRFNWNGATFLGVGGGLESCFEIQQGYPVILQHLGFENASFDGTVSQAFIRFRTGSSWYCDFKRLRAKSTAVAPALLNFHNESAVANPGLMICDRILAPASGVDHTILFSKEAAALGDFDDFRINTVQGGMVSSLEIETGCNLLQSDIANVVASGHAIRTVNTGTVQNSRIARIYSEPLITPCYALSGNFHGCDVNTVRGWIADYRLTDFRAAYGTFTDTVFRNIGMWATIAYVDEDDVEYTGAPYKYYGYPFLTILAGENVTVEFPAKYVERAVRMGDSSAVYPVTFVNAPFPLIENVDDTLPEWKCYGSHITNYGQGAAATITLPLAKANMRLRATMQQTGFAFTLKPDAANSIILDGTTLTTGNKVTNTTPAKGDSIELYTYISGFTEGADDYQYNWKARTDGGTWADGGA